MITIRRLAAFFALLLAVSAFGVSTDDGARHLRLLRSQPAADTTMTVVPEAVHFWFSEAPEIKVTTVRLTVPGGRTVTLENVNADTEDASHVVAPVTAISGAGAYKVEWRTMSKDGHIVSGDLSFSVKADH